MDDIITTSFFCYSNRSINVLEMVAEFKSDFFEIIISVENVFTFFGESLHWHKRASCVMLQSDHFHSKLGHRKLMNCY